VYSRFKYYYNLKLHFKRCTSLYTPINFIVLNFCSIASFSPHIIVILHMYYANYISNISVLLPIASCYQCVSCVLANVPIVTFNVLLDHISTQHHSYSSTLVCITRHMLSHVGASLSIISSYIIV